MAVTAAYRLSVLFQAKRGVAERGDRAAFAGGMEVVSSDLMPMVCEGFVGWVLCHRSAAK
jgi:hypothetical protein